MPYVKRPFTTQPAWAAPIAAKWRDGHLFTINPGSGLHPGPLSSITYETDCIRRATAKGWAFSLPGTAAFIEMRSPVFNRLQNVPEYSLAYSFTPSSLGVNGGLFSVYEGASRVLRAFFRFGSGGAITHEYRFNISGDGWDFVSTVVPVVNVAQVWVATMRGNRWTYYLNGSVAATGTAVYPIVFWGNSNKTLRVGGDSTIIVDQISMWSRAFSADEVARYSANINCIFERSLYIPESSVSAATYTLTSATYVPGSLTSTSVTPRIVRTKA